MVESCEERDVPHWRLERRGRASPRLDALLHICSYCCCTVCKYAVPCGVWLWHTARPCRGRRTFVTDVDTTSEVEPHESAGISVNNDQHLSVTGNIFGWAD
ncbi:unnamed protein product [Pylaiella littoralis]